MKVIGERIGRLLYENEKTQLWLSERTGICLVTINRIINNRSEPTAPTIVKICEALGVSADWLLGLSDRKERDA